MNTVISFIMDNKATIALSIPLIGRAYHSLKNGGGIVGMWRALMYGTSTPTKTDAKG